jgi:hypothetical protein
MGALLDLEFFIDRNWLDDFPIGTTDQFNRRVAIAIELDDIDCGVLLLQAKDIFNGNTQNIGEDDPVDPTVADYYDIALEVAVDDFLKLRQDTVSELGKRFSSFNLKCSDIFHALA